MRISVSPCVFWLSFLRNANLEVKVRDLETTIDSANREARRLEGQLHKSAQDLERQSQDLVQLQGQLANTKVSAVI